MTAMRPDIGTPRAAKLCAKVSMWLSLPNPLGTKIAANANRPSSIKKLPPAAAMRSRNPPIPAPRIASLAAR